MQNAKCKMVVSALPTNFNDLRNKYLYYALCIMNYASKISL